MKLVERAGLLALHQIDPETGHGLALRALRAGVVPLPGPMTSDRLATDVAGLKLTNPVGLAAGFDKNAVAIAPLARAGFGFIEVGAATPRPQPGNPRPRLFRLKSDRAVINRFGFNNEGMEAINARLTAARAAGAAGDIPVGLNLGANKDSDDRAADFARVLTHCGGALDFATVNVSSPNTEKLRDLQGAEALAALLDGVMAARAKLDRPIPIFLKIAPDLTETEVLDVAKVAISSGISGVITTNTTLSRDGLTDAQAGEMGGLSGAPLFEKSTRITAQLSHALDGAMPLIGVGGISNADQAYAKIRAGASAVQVYSALVYRGFSMVGDIVRGLDALLARDGFACVADAVGTDRDAWG